MQTAMRATMGTTLRSAVPTAGRVSDCNGLVCFAFAFLFGN